MNPRWRLLALLHWQWSRVRESLTDALSRPFAQLFWLEEHPIGIARMFARPVLEEPAQHDGLVGLILVDEDLKDWRGGK